MKKILISLLILSVMLTAFACVGASSKGGSFGKGKVMGLEFETNPSTGYNWEYKFVNGYEKSILKVVKTYSDTGNISEKDMQKANSEEDLLKLLNDYD